MTTSSPTATTSSPPAERLRSLDQFRGYTVAGMLLVNFLGGFAVCPEVLRHSHDHLSYADTIMPQFLFAVGFALRLTFGRRMQQQGSWAAYGRLVRRLLGLVLISFVVYQVGPRAETWEQLTRQSLGDVLHDPLKRNWFQTLMHIAVTSLWLVPVLAARPSVRIAWMLASAAAHVGLSYWFNFVWANTSPNAIDGGPLGFLTWTIPATVGTLACDAFAAAASRPRYGSLLAAAALLMGLGYLFSCGTRLYDVPASLAGTVEIQKLADNPVIPTHEQVERHLQTGGPARLLAEPPFVAPPDAAHRQWNYWMMSQRAGTLSYLTFSAGFSLAVYLLFVVACDRYRWEIPLFRTFGVNALATYVLHEMVGEAVKPFMPKDAPGWYVAAGLFVFFAITWMIVRHLEKRGIYLRV